MAGQREPIAVIGTGYVGLVTAAGFAEVGTRAAIKRMMLEQGKPGFAYVSCPEFLKEGDALKDFLNPDRVVVGDDGDWAGDAVVDLYAQLNAPLVRTDVASAEMIKLAAN